ncbi:thioredoxin domain-containing protein [Herbiconiux sp. CPCC 203407]|uniref:Thioredoxin domain-containing protein n=1 Tax=Herbiconiux oxytropis TaxID=2970915 RepID=A0AA42BTL6_9MICO|nr:thioredoxin domain-containing protein [Herbiconiux oxytropis]MCS5721412.1 thioredoxin domain-containing protein [Herbiconiux oxytropis]MCS5724489.1 thioredoxin domain-containing protein [Herbiconiux oxytropis]
MTNRLADAVSPYLRSHASNPVDWFPWGEEAFAEARRRNVPLLVSIGYSTCHWCHVMARESFADPVLAGRLNARFVAIKVDREEHPEVDSVYLTAAGAFTPNLGWPLNVFVTPDGRPFYAGTYWPPVPVDGHPAFSQVLDAVDEAWTARHEEVVDTAERLAAAIAGAVGPGAAARAGGTDPLPDIANISTAIDGLLAREDREHGGFGDAPKFPMAPVLGLLLETPGESTGERFGAARAVAHRALTAMARSELRDQVEGGFFRYGTRRDWSEPHYERMLYDNALLLDAYTTAWAQTGDELLRETAEGIARYLVHGLQLPSGGFASAQDSESTVDGARTEGGYYRLDAAARAGQTPPALDEKVLAGWNGLAIGALAHASFALDHPEWMLAAQHAADHLLALHVVSADDGTIRLVRASIAGRLSSAASTPEDYGLLAEGLLRLAAVTGSARYAEAGRMLVRALVDSGFRAPGGGDPVLAAQGLLVELDPSEGAYPSATSATASALLLLHGLTGESHYREAARELLAPLGPQALAQPISFGRTLQLISSFGQPEEQLVLLEPDPVAAVDPGPADPDGPADAAAAADPAALELRAAVRRRTGALVAVATDSEARLLADAGFSLFADRSTRDARPTAYLCHDFVCRLPTTTAGGLGS